MSTTTAPGGSLREMTDEECWVHLGEASVGRIGYVDRGGPVVVPLNYLAQDGLIWVRTASYNQLAIHLPGQQFAFEIDHVDERSRVGWSVLVRGRAEHVAGGYPAPSAGWPDPTPWPAGIRTMVFCLTPAEVTGRTLHRAAAPAASGHGPGTVQRRSDEPG